MPRQRRKFVQDTNGAAVVLVAVMMVPLVGAAGVAIDSARGFIVQSQLTAALDAAGLAAAQETGEAAQRAEAERFFNVNTDIATPGVRVFGPGLTVSEDQSTLTLTASAEVDTLFARVLGREVIDVNAQAVILREERGIELALVLDNTGSMRGLGEDGRRRIDAMRDAATTLIENLFGNRETVQSLRVALVPFTSTVNIGPQRTDFLALDGEVGIIDLEEERPDLFDPKANANTGIWVDVSLDHLVPPFTNDNPDPDVGAFNLFEEITELGITALPDLADEARDFLEEFEPDDFDQATFPEMLKLADQSELELLLEAVSGTLTRFEGQDEILDLAIDFGFDLETGWVQPPGTGANTDPEPVLRALVRWRGCVEARHGPLGNDRTDALPEAEPFTPFIYPSDIDNVWPPTRTNNLAKDDGLGPNLGCGPAVTPLIAERTTVLDNIAVMEPWHRGGTAANLGLAWGWRMLSTRWQGRWAPESEIDRPVGPEQPDIEKIIVLLTDGENQAFDFQGHPSPAGPRGSDFTGYGRVGDELLGPGINTQNTARAEIDRRMMQLCQAIQADGILVYTIVFGVNSPELQNLFEGCASDTIKFFNSPTNQALDATFEALSEEFSRLRIAG